MKCKKILSDNQQCRAFSQKGRDFCFRHDPTSNKAKLVASSKGGQNRALQGVYGASVRLETPEDVKKFLSTVINAVWAEGIPVPVGSSMGFLAKCWLEAHNTSEIQSRLEELEDKVEKSITGQNN